MSRLHIATVENSPEASKPLLAAVLQQLGIVPNLMKLVGASPAALEGYLSLNGALAKGQLNVRQREQIALAIAEFNGCDYCLSAHDYLGRNVARLDAAEIDAAREGHSSTPASDAALQFALQVAKSRGQVADADLAAVRAAGFDDGAIIDIVTTVALNVLTNYVNNVARTDIDFPEVRARAAA